MSNIRSKQAFESEDEVGKTWKAILRAIEQLFAKRGIEATTMREITFNAGTNLPRKQPADWHQGALQRAAC